MTRAGGLTQARPPPLYGARGLSGDGVSEARMAPGRRLLGSVWRQRAYGQEVPPSEARGCGPALPSAVLACGLCLPAGRP